MIVAGQSHHRDRRFERRGWRRLRILWFGYRHGDDHVLDRSLAPIQNN